MFWEEWDENNPCVCVFPMWAMCVMCVVTAGAASLHLNLDPALMTAITWTWTREHTHTDTQQPVLAPSHVSKYADDDVLISSHLRRRSWLPSTQHVLILSCSMWSSTVCLRVCVRVTNLYHITPETLCSVWPHSCTVIKVWRPNSVLIYSSHLTSQQHRQAETQV